ncbi:MAG: hypothetical protein IT377_07375 [Polyangiaceae bacterium]|nr:hypothetical protein [Polyangiaceae bacterium]
MSKHDAGLAAIGRSARRVKPTTEARRAPVWATDAKPPLEFEGRKHKTSVNLDVGMWDCVLETAHVLSKRARAKGRRRVNIVDVLETAFVSFHELSLEQQLERLRNHR